MCACFGVTRSLSLVEAAELAICKANCLEFFNVASEIKQLDTLQLLCHALCSCQGEMVLARKWELTRAEGNRDIAQLAYTVVSLVVLDALSDVELSTCTTLPPTFGCTMAHDAKHKHSRLFGSHIEARQPWKSRIEANALPEHP